MRIKHFRSNGWGHNRPLHSRSNRWVHSRPLHSRSNRWGHRRHPRSVHTKDTQNRTVSRHGCFVTTEGDAGFSFNQIQEYIMRLPLSLALVCAILMLLSTSDLCAQDRSAGSQNLTSTIKSKLGSRPLVVQWSTGESSATQAQVNWDLQPVWKMFEDPLTAKQIRVQLLDNTGRPWWNLDGPSSRPIGKWTPSVSPIHKDVSAFLKAGSDFRLVITDMTGQSITHPVTLQMLSPTAPPGPEGGTGAPTGGSGDPTTPQPPPSPQPPPPPPPESPTPPPSPPPRP